MVSEKRLQGTLNQSTCSRRANLGHQQLVDRESIQIAGYLASYRDANGPGRTIFQIFTGLKVVCVPRSMLLDLRVLMISSWEASPNCLVRFSDMLCLPKPSRWNAGSGSPWSGIPELLRQTEER